METSFSALLRLFTLHIFKQTNRQNIEVISYTNHMGTAPAITMKFTLFKPITYTYISSSIRYRKCRTLVTGLPQGQGWQHCFVAYTNCCVHKQSLTSGVTAGNINCFHLFNTVHVNSGRQGQTRMLDSYFKSNVNLKVIKNFDRRTLHNDIFNRFRGITGMRFLKLVYLQRMENFENKISKVEMCSGILSKSYNLNKVHLICIILYDVGLIKINKTFCLLSVLMMYSAKTCITLP